MSDVAIRVENLSKRYKLGEREPYKSIRDVLARAVASPMKHLKGEAEEASGYIWALDDVSFEVKQGEAVGIIGRNGAGKSTLLKVLSRITKPTKGKATIYGRVGSLLEVGTGFHPELTGRENIYLNGAILGMKRQEIARKFDEIVAFAEIEQFLDTPVKRYSSGMYVRLAFAVAAHLEPEILLVDEVLAVGDAAFQKKCLGKMGQVAQEGRTVLFVSHNMAAVSQLCSQGIWIESGYIKKEDLVQKVIQDYLVSGKSQIARKEWNFPGDAPGDERVRLLAGQIIQNKNPTSVVDINRPFFIEMEFLVLKQLRNLVTGVSFYGNDESCLTASCDWRKNFMEPGKYRKKIYIPARVFGEGTISILLQLIFYDPDIRSAVVPNALRFEACDSDHELSVRGPYKGHWPGLLRLEFKWSDEIYIKESFHNG